ERIKERMRAEGLREGSTAIEELQVELSPELSMDSTEEDIIKQVQIRASLNAILERMRMQLVEQPVREQFESDRRALTEAEQDPKELRSAKRHLLFDRIEEALELPFPAGPVVVEGEKAPKDSITRNYVKRAAEAIYKDLVRRRIAVEKIRPDGRGSEDIRPVTCEVGVAPRPHGSALFTRGQTQWNGSSWMGSVCGSHLGLQEAGVPVKEPLSGIEMGLVKEGDDYVILTDIEGAEEHLSDMDFKGAGTRDGVTALQMDIKIT